MSTNAPTFPTPPLPAPAAPPAAPLPFPRPAVLDLSDLTPEAVQMVREFAAHLRAQEKYRRPPKVDDAEKWIADFMAWTASRPRIPVEVDVDRGRMYEGCGE